MIFNHLQLSKSWDSLLEKKVGETSVADPGGLSQIRIFSIPDPDTNTQNERI